VRLWRHCLGHVCWHAASAHPEIWDWLAAPYSRVTSWQPTVPSVVSIDVFSNDCRDSPLSPLTSPRWFIISSFISSFCYVSVVCCGSVSVGLLGQDTGSPLGCALLSSLHLFLSTLSSMSLTRACHQASRERRRRAGGGRDSGSQDITIWETEDRNSKSVWGGWGDVGGDGEASKAPWKWLGLSTISMSPTLLIRTMKGIMMTVGVPTGGYF